MTKCTKPPSGWECTRGDHSGPCAAIPSYFMTSPDFVAGLVGGCPFCKGLNSKNCGKCKSGSIMFCVVGGTLLECGKCMAAGEVDGKKCTNCLGTGRLLFSNYDEET